MTARRRRSSSPHPGTYPVFLAIFLLVLCVQSVKSASDYDPYKILGVSRIASQAEIKRAYKNLAREWWVGGLIDSTITSFNWNSSLSLCVLCASTLTRKLVPVVIHLIMKMSQLLLPKWTWQQLMLFWLSNKYDVITFRLLFYFSCRHPDKNKDPNAEDMFIKISKSYEVGGWVQMHHITPTTCSCHLQVLFPSLCLSFCILSLLCPADFVQRRT